MRSAVTRAVLVVVALTAVAGLLRFSELGRPQRKVFDEVYYASDGCWYAGVDYRECGLDSGGERTWVHPPLGKRLIALGIDAFGNRPFGWRAAAAGAGTLTVALVGILAFLLFRSPLWAGVAATLAGAEHLLFVQSRISMLDVFLTMFVVLGFVLLVADHRRRDRVPSPAPGGFERSESPGEAAGNPGPGPAAVRPATEETAPEAAPEAAWAAPRHAPRVEHRVWRPLRLLAGAALGAAVAVKWSGALALLAAALLALGWGATRLRRDPRGLAAGPLAAEVAGIALALGVVPLLVYGAAWVPWLADRGFDLGQWVGHHVDMASFHWNLESVDASGEPVHPYMSEAWTWFLLLRPVHYFWRGDPNCCANIVAIGNPVLFWGAFLYVPYLIFAWRRDWRAGVSVVPILVQYLPWLLISRPLFLFYMTPVTPFLALGAAHAARNLARARMPGRGALAPVAAVLVLAAVLAFAFYWPTLVAEPMTYAEWRMRFRVPSWIGGLG